MERRRGYSEASPDPRAAEPGPAANGSTGGGAAAPPGGADASFDANMVIILAALFLALLFAIGLNSLARCALRCGGRGGGGGEGAASRSGGGGGGRRAASACVSGSGGIKKRALRSIPVEVYGTHGAEAGAGEEDVCAICLGEFADGEKVRVLPRCGHGFHVPCVDAWLLSHGSCPTCRRPVMDAKPSAKAAAAGGGAGQSRRRPDSDTIAVVIA